MASLWSLLGTLSHRSPIWACFLGCGGVCFLFSIQSADSSHTLLALASSTGYSFDSPGHLLLDCGVSFITKTLKQPSEREEQWRNTSVLYCWSWKDVKGQLKMMSDFLALIISFSSHLRKGVWSEIASSYLNSKCFLGFPSSSYVTHPDLFIPGPATQEEL